MSHVDRRAGSAEVSDQVDRLTRVADEFFRTYLDANPVEATALGFDGYDHLVPDPSREADARQRQKLDGLTAQLTGIEPHRLPEQHWVTADMLARQLDDRRATLHAGLSEVSVSASVAGRLSDVLASVPEVSITDADAAEAYLTRLAGLGTYFDALAERHRVAAADGRTPTAIGLRQAIEQVDGYLGTAPDTDPFLRPRPEPGSHIDEVAWPDRVREMLENSLRPALVRYRDRLAELAAETDPRRRPRDDDHVGVLHVPDGPDGYRVAIRRHTTTDATPEEIHQLGLDLVGRIREEFAELGSRVFRTSDVSSILQRLQHDPTLRFETAEEIESTVTDALHRAEAAVPDWFRSYRIAPCEVRRMSEAEARGGVLGYYLPPAGDGSRPGAHVVNTHQPATRTRFEYETLAFHESVPGHHLQIAIAQSMHGLPDFRRFMYVNAHAEGWGLYVERLCDRMGLYTDDLSRFGMLSWDAWRACRLVVDTGMHAFGWSRERAIDYMRQNTAHSESNITNEVDRYIADPGQALAYMVGRIRIEELAEQARTALGSAFDIRAYHHVVLGNGNLALSTLQRLVRSWIERGG